MVGVKFFNFHMISWCFQVMGNHVSCLQLPDEDHDHQLQLPDDEMMMRSRRCSSSVKVIQSDGVVKIYHRPVHASEIMVEFPKHLICHSDSFCIGQKIPPLSADEELKLGHKYFLLPNHFFQSVLSFVTLASFTSSSSKVVKNVAGIRPFDIFKTPQGTLQIRVCDEFISKLMEHGGHQVKDDQHPTVLQQVHQEEEAAAMMKKMMSGGDHQNHLHEVINDENIKKVIIHEKVCTTPKLQKDYTQLVGSRFQQWRPKLETIKEISGTDHRNIIRSCRFGGAFGIKRRKKKLKSKGNGNGNGGFLKLWMLHRSDSPKQC